MLMKTALYEKPFSLSHRAIEVESFPPETEAIIVLSPMYFEF